MDQPSPAALSLVRRAVAEHSAAIRHLQTLLAEYDEAGTTSEDPHFGKFLTVVAVLAYQQQRVIEAWFGPDQPLANDRPPRWPEDWLNTP